MPSLFRAPRFVQELASALRDRIVVRPGFQRAAARVPGLRWIARRRAKHVFDLCAGFVYSQILLVSVELGLLDALAERPRTLAEIEALAALPSTGSERLVRGAIALDLVERRRGERFGLGAVGAAIVGNPAVQAMIRHHSMLYADLADPIALLRGETARGRMAEYWAYAKAHDPRALPSSAVVAYTDLMAESQTLIADQVLDAYRLDRHSSLLDVGGGRGAFLIAAARRAPALRLTLFDLPPVVERARGAIAEAGLADRIELVGGSFFDDDLPRGHDLITFVRILHDHDDDAVRVVLRRARAALEPGGTLLVAEPMAETPGARSVGDAYFSFYLLAMGSGRSRTVEELEGLLGETGFGAFTLHRTDLPLQTRVLTAKAV